MSHDPTNLNPEISPVQNKVEIELLKRDVGMIHKLCEKFDVAIDKIQQVASDISRIVSVHEQRLYSQEKINVEVESTLEKHSKDNSADHRILNEKIASVNDLLNHKIEQTEVKILNEIATLKTDLSKQITEIDKWRYTVVGAVMLVAFILSQIIDLSKLFH